MHLCSYSYTVLFFACFDIYSVVFPPRLTGKGIVTYFEEAIYDGDWVKDCMHGRGVFKDNYGE